MSQARHDARHDPGTHGVLGGEELPLPAFGGQLGRAEIEGIGRIHLGEGLGCIAPPVLLHAGPAESVTGCVFHLRGGGPLGELPEQGVGPVILPLSVIGLACEEEGLPGKGAVRRLLQGLPESGPRIFVPALLEMADPDQVARQGNAGVLRKEIDEPVQFGYRLPVAPPLHEGAGLLKLGLAVQDPLPCGCMGDGGQQDEQHYQHAAESSGAGPASRERPGRSEWVAHVLDG